MRRAMVSGANREATEACSSAGEKPAGASGSPEATARAVDMAVDNANASEAAVCAGAMKPLTASVTTSRWPASPNVTGMAPQAIPSISVAPIVSYFDELITTVAPA